MIGSGLRFAGCELSSPIYNDEEKNLNEDRLWETCPNRLRCLVLQKRFGLTKVGYVALVPNHRYHGRDIRRHGRLIPPPPKFIFPSYVRSRGTNCQFSNKKAHVSPFGNFLYIRLEYSPTGYVTGSGTQVAYLKRT